jgi:hypothetical protein
MGVGIWIGVLVLMMLLLLCAVYFIFCVFVWLIMFAPHEQNNLPIAQKMRT